MGSLRLALPCLLAVAACPAPPPPAPPPPDYRGTAADNSPAPTADAGAPETRDYAQPPPADDAVFAEVSEPLPVDPGPAPSSGRVPASGCLPPGDPRIAKLQGEAAAWTRASFAAALRRQGLVQARLGMTRKVLHRGIDGYGNVANGARMDTVVKTSGGAFIAGGTYWSGSAGSPQPWELAKNGRGEFFRLQRQPLPGGSIKNVIVCGCAPQTCGPYGSGCPSCGSTSQEMYGPLPAGATYKGPIEVRYPVANVLVQREKGACPRQRPCPGPPP